MPSFEERIKNNVNEGIADPIWENERKTINKIFGIFSKDGGSIYKEVRLKSFGDSRNYFTSGMSRIYFDRNEVVYCVVADEVGDVELARIKPDKVEFPLYGEKPKVERRGLEKQITGFEEIGQIPLSEVKDTVIETIERRVREHPVFGKYADMILGDFKNILSLDPEREIEPISEEAKVNAVLKEDNHFLKEENQRKDSQISRLQAMLNKTLEFARSVRDSIVGKIFFKNKIAQLNLPEGELLEGDKDER